MQPLYRRAPKASEVRACSLSTIAMRANNTTPASNTDTARGVQRERACAGLGTEQVEDWEVSASGYPKTDSDPTHM